MSSQKSIMRNFTNFKIIMFKLQNSYLTNYGPKKIHK
jgi:hypothetical protein